MCDFSRVSAWFCDEKFSLKKVVSTFTSGGDMSIVGTRPPLISETNLYEPRHKARLSMKQALHLKCDLEDVWQAVQDLCADSKGRLLFVIDNIENIGNDEFLGKLSMLPCRVLITSRQKILRGFNRIMYLPPLKMAQCRDLFYQHYQYAERDNEVLNDIIDLTARLSI